jgi:hypothetical protein
MTEADFQLTVSAITPIVVAVCGTITAVYAAQAHQQGQVNAAKIDAVKETVDGSAHALASNLQTQSNLQADTIRTLAANTLTTKPPPEAP